MCICMWICIYLCIYVYICIYLYMYVYIYVYIYISQPPRSQIVLEDDAEELLLVNLEDVTFVNDMYITCI
jgi:hypothetical protein